MVNKLPLLSHGILLPLQWSGRHPGSWQSSAVNCTYTPNSTMIPALNGCCSGR
ncbi:transposase [Colletotrichum scovillei]|nr:transposase [Colletotrichum scovillei]